MTPLKLRGLLEDRILWRSVLLEVATPRRLSIAIEEGVELDQNVLVGS